MKLKTGQKRYKFPDYGEIISVILLNGKHNKFGAAFRLQIVSREEIGKTHGFPTQCAFWNNWIEFWPIPDKPYEVRVRYSPPIEEY